MGKLGGHNKGYQRASARLRVPGELCGSFQVEEDKRTGASGAAQVTGIKEIQQRKTWDGGEGLSKLPTKLNRQLLLVSAGSPHRRSGVNAR